jgi:hypothetical protein
MNSQHKDDYQLMDSPLMALQSQALKHLKTNLPTTLQSDLS